MAIRAVIFDLGHTIWDFAPSEHGRRLNVLRLHALLEAAGSGDTPSPLELDRAMGLAAQRWFAEWYDDRTKLEQPPSETIVANGLRELGLPAPDNLVTELTRILFAAEVDVPVVEWDTLVALATLDQRGIAMGCVTNTIALEEGILDALVRLGLPRYFRSVVVSSEMGYRKPHASLFQRALDELDVAPHEAVFVGDRLFDDIGGAKALGMWGVLTHQYRQEPLEGVTPAPDAVITRLGELPQVIERLAAP